MTIKLDPLWIPSQIQPLHLMNENTDSLIEKLRMRRDAIEKQLPELVKELERLESILALEEK